MIALDTNVLVYAHRADVPEHGLALDAVRQIVEGRRRWALPWTVVHEFLAVMTRVAPALAPEVALEAARRLLAAPGCMALAEPAGYLDTLDEAVTTSRASGVRVFDARIAATCMAHGVSELWTADRDFSRFPRLRTRNPLI